MIDSSRNRKPEPAPTRIDCAERCRIPEGAELLQVPPPRHAWGDVLHCPNDGCGRAFLITKDPRSAAPECGGVG